MTQPHLPIGARAAALALSLVAIGLPPRAAAAQNITYSSISAGAQFACVIRKGALVPSTVVPSAVLCWGDAIGGELGNGVVTDSSQPQPTPSIVQGLLASPRQVSAGNGFACAVTTAGTVQCWGWNYLGQAGVPVSNLNSNLYKATVVFGVSNAIQVSAGADHACAVDAQGGVFCWGGNSHGQIGLPTAIPSRSTPFHVSLPFPAISVSAGSSATCAVLQNTVTVNGKTSHPHFVYCWGDNEYGVLGNSNYVQHSPPVPVALSEWVESVSMGDTVACALDVMGLESCWGMPGIGDDGEIGSGVTHTTATLGPEPVLQGNWGKPFTFQTIATGALRYTNCSSDTTATSAGMACWGDDYNYQLGNANVTVDHVAYPLQSTTFTGVVGFNTVLPPTEIALSYDFGCALASYGITIVPIGPTYTNHVVCWGKNASGQLATDLSTQYLPGPTVVL